MIMNKCQNTTSNNNNIPYSMICSFEVKDDKCTS